ncbi:MAG: helix-turn-helix transcriptional regulator, partial [Paraglaciecola chathamensis]
MALTRTPINGQRLKRLRKEAGLSQEALAERLSITRETVNKIE